MKRVKNASCDWEPGSVALSFRRTHTPDSLSQLPRSPLAGSKVTLVERPGSTEVFVLPAERFTRVGRHR